MIHYHGLPITPGSACAAAITGGHAFVSHAHPDQLTIAMDCAQTFAVDNGAFSAWSAGAPVTDWMPYYQWVLGLSYHPAFDFAVIPDIIDGSERENDILLGQWPLPKHFGAPVWHLHESISRLLGLCRQWQRVCLGSSGEYAQIGTKQWWSRMHEVMQAATDEQGRPKCKLHGLRMLDPEIFARFPFASADSTNIGRNIGIDSRWKGTYTPPSKEVRAQIIRARIESVQSAPTWSGTQPQGHLFQLAASK